MKNWSLLLSVFLLFSFQEKPGPITSTEVELKAADKEFLLEYFEVTRENLEEATEDLSEAQLQYKPAEDRWSVSEVLEHIILTEESIFGMTRELMAKSPAPERRAEIKNSDEELVMGVEDRTQKFQASADLQPTGKYIRAEEALDNFEDQREEIVEFIKTTTEKDLRDHISDSPFGAIDGYQSLLFLAGHTARHTKQIKEVLADPGFPEM